MKAKDVMETEVISVRPDMKVREVARILYEHELSALPVVDENDKILGMVSEGDLIYRLSKPHLPPHVEILGGIIYLENPFEMKKEIEKLTAVTAKEIMTKKVRTVSVDADLSDVADVMIEKNVNGLPVTKDKKLVGIITRHDLLLALAGNKIEVKAETAPENDKAEE